MFLFKASGKTYARVKKHAVHAFPFGPHEAPSGQFVLLSKNREDCRPTERQIQCAAKLLRVRPATPAELDERFPGVGAGQRWRFAVELYWMRPLEEPFNLSQVRGIKARRYDAVQGFARIDDVDEQALLKHLIRTNPRVILDFINNAEQPKTDA